MSELIIEQHIVNDGSGKARIQGVGVAVRMIAELHNLGWTVEQLTEHYELTPAQVYAALSFYYDHKADMDAAIQAGQALAAAVPSTEVLKQRIANRSV